MNRTARVAHRSRSLIVGVSGLLPLLLPGVACLSASAHRTAGCTNRIGVGGPTANASNVFFNETVFGCATGKANYVISGEQRTRSGGCANTYSAEAARSSFYQWPTGTGRVHATFSLAVKFYSHVPGTHGICSYVVNHRTKQTYARAGRFWTNS